MNNEKIINWAISHELLDKEELNQIIFERLKSDSQLMTIFSDYGFFDFFRYDRGFDGDIGKKVSSKVANVCFPETLPSDIEYKFIDLNSLGYFFVSQLVALDGWYTPDGYNFYESEDLYYSIEEYES